MLDKLTRKLAEKMGQSVKESVKPLQEEVSRKVDYKVDLYSKIVRFGVLVFLFIEGTKRIANMEDKEPNSGPSQIVINNYLYRKEDDET